MSQIYSKHPGSVAALCVAIAALAIGIPLSINWSSDKAGNDRTSAQPRYPHAERLAKLATHFANTDYCYSTCRRLLPENVAGAIVGLAHLTPPGPSDFQIEWRLRGLAIVDTSPKSFLKVKQKGPPEYSRAFWDCLADEWTGAAEHFPELKGANSLIRRAAAVHTVALQHQNVDHKQVQRELEDMSEWVTECKFVDYESFGQFRLTLEQRRGDYHFTLELYDTQKASGGPWRRAVLYFDYLTEFSPVTPAQQEQAEKASRRS